LKNLLKILILTLIFSSCKKEIDSIPELVESDFNLKTDILDFKNKMTELDTIKIWFNHSVCMYEGAEKIEITKKSNLINIQTEFKEHAYEESPEWKIVYQKSIQTIDTTWKIEEFLKRNSSRQESSEKEFGTLQISHNENKIHYFTNGLGDLNSFMADFFETMKTIHPENKNGIYGVDIIEIEDLKNKKND
jgi:hypothetical protein